MSKIMFRKLHLKNLIQGRYGPLILLIWPRKQISGVKMGVFKGSGFNGADVDILKGHFGGQ